MVNELKSQEWAYLLDPCFQLVNTNGKPLTNGHIEVFYHGTRTPYYCASDWNGTLHPFKIKIDSLGSNVVLADPKFSYDVYVYNAYGVLQMSRYNVNPGSGSGGGSSGEGGPAEHWSSDTAGGASTTVTGGTTVYLTLPSSEDQPEFVDNTTDTAIFLKGGLYHIDAVVSFKQDEDDLQNIIKDIVVNTGLIGWDAQMTGQKNWTGPESTDDDRHFLEIHTVVSVPEDLLQPLYFQIASPVDLDSAAIEKLDIVKLTAGGGGMTYAAGYGIQIDGQVISTSGMMPEASAANFVDNSTYQVDIQNIYEAIAETSGQIPSGVATQDWVTDYTSAFITSADLPDLSDYATQTWVQDQGYLTSVPSEYVTQSEMEDYTSAFITSADLPDESVPLVAGEGISIVDTSASSIISLDSAYGIATQDWVTDYTSAFITSADIPPIPQDVVTSGELATVSGEIVSQIPSLDGYATQNWVQDQGYLTSVPEEYVTQTEMENYTSAFITSADIPDVPEDLVTSAELASTSAALESLIPSLDGYATEQYVEDYTSAFITSADVPQFTQEQADWDEDDPTAPDYIKNKPSIPSIEGLASEQYVQDYVVDYTSAFITSADIPDVPPDVVTSGQLATVSAQLENDIPIYTAGSHIDITNIKEISVTGVSGLLAGENVTITTSGGNYYINSTGGGGSGSEVDIIPTIQTGTKIADYVIDGTSGALYAPAEGGGSTYYAGDNISIENDVISVSGTAGLIAGENISITASGDNYVISSTGGGGDIPADVVTSGQLATVSAQIEADIPSLSGYATESWVQQQGYLTSIPAEYATSGDLATVSGKLSSVSTFYVNGFFPYQTTYQSLRFNYGNGIPSSSANLQRLVEVGNGSTYSPLGELVPVPPTSGLVLTSLNGNIMSWKEPYGGGSEVDIIPSLQTGTKIADYVIDGTSGALYAPAGGGGSTYYAGDHIVIDQNNYISTSGLMVENSAFMIDSAGYANRVAAGGAGGTLNLGRVAGYVALQVIGLQDDVEYTLNCSGYTDGVQLYQGYMYSIPQGDTAIYPTNNEIKFTKSDFYNVYSTGDYYLYFEYPQELLGNNVTLSYVANTRYALVDQLPTSGQLLPDGGSNGQVVTNFSGSPVWSDPSFTGVYSSPINTTPNTVEVVTSLPAYPISSRIYLIPES